MSWWNLILQTSSLWLGSRRCAGLCLVWKALTFLSLCWSALGRAAHFHKVLFSQQCLKGNASQAQQVDVIIKRVYSVRISTYSDALPERCLWEEVHHQRWNVGYIRFVFLCFQRKPPTCYPTTITVHCHKVILSSVIPKLTINKV